ncbi:MAG: carboxypeptidase M32 [Sphaerochaetaceae bacterium]
MRDQKAYKRLVEIDHEVTLLSHIQSTLVWDQEHVPPSAQDQRASYLAYLEKKIHSLISSNEMGELLEAIETQDDPATEGVVRHYQKSYNRSKKLSSEFVQLFSETTSKAHYTWAQARSEDNFELYEPTLTRIVELVQQKAELYGYEDEPYDALIDVFEPGTTTKEVSLLFSELKQTTTEILAHKEDESPYTFLQTHYPKDKQELFIKEMLTTIGFDWKRGVLGESTHPYTITLGSDDIRITTRYGESDVTSPLFSALHEGGHALYEMGASNEVTRNLSIASGASLAFHESQSRLWENILGRSRSFWTYFFPRFKQLFSTQLEYVDLNTFMKAIHRVQRTPIRVEADEVTYNLHIILRFELERLLLNGELKVRELPHAWKEMTKELLSYEVKNNREGLLQDIHWSMGEFGYFPTYALGNIYSAHIAHKMRETLDIDALLAEGEFSLILGWLHEHIYQYGAIYEPKELLMNITGEKASVSYLDAYLRNRYLKEYSYEPAK